MIYGESIIDLQGKVSPIEYLYNYWKHRRLIDKIKFTIPGSFIIPTRNLDLRRMLNHLDLYWATLSLISHYLCRLPHQLFRSLYSSSLGIYNSLYKTPHLAFGFLLKVISSNFNKTPHPFFDLYWGPSDHCTSIMLFITLLDPKKLCRTYI